MKVFKTFFKIIILALIFAIWINYAYSLLSWSTKKDSEITWSWEISNNSWSENNNKYNFKESKTELLSPVWVAISTNIWTRFKEKVKVSSTVSNKNYSSNSYISKNMMFISEYYNILKTDVKKILEESKDRNATLTVFVDQIWYRYTNSIENVKILSTRKSELSSQINAISTQIESLKQKISWDFSRFDALSTEENIKTYLTLQNEYSKAKTEIIFINEFLKQYNHLNEYNKILLDTLINNRDILVKNSRVVIPDSGMKVLNKLNLIISEADYKSINGN